MKRKEKTKIRTDVLTGKAAEAFARDNTNFYLYQDFFYQGKSVTLLKSLDSEDYYLAKIAEKQGFLSGDVTHFVEMIHTQPIRPVMVNGEFKITKPRLSFGCNVAVEDDESMKTLYFGDTLYLYKTEEDRDNFEMFCLESCCYKPKFDLLDKLSEYFSDENFVLMAKDKAFYLAFYIAEDLTTIGKNLLEHKIKKEIDKRVVKYAGQSAESGQMGEE